MSNHAQPSLAALQQLRKQRRNSTISSILIALLVCALMVTILFYIALSPLFKITENLVTYNSGAAETEETITKPEMQNEVEKKPSAPSASMAQVINAATPLPTSVPVPDVVIEEPSLDFGDGNDFGDGWGSESAHGNSGGGVTFFKQSVKAERVCYIIDYSRSMKSKGKFELMKKELSKSVKDLPDNIDFQLIFFAGKAWLASDELEISGKKIIHITRDGKKYAKGKGLPKPRWITSDKDTRNLSLKHIEDTPMVYGTKWHVPMHMAFEMVPTPDIIFFMTDGTAGKKTYEVSKKLASIAKRKGVIVNCVALMEPKAREAMSHLAKETSGAFTMVNEKGRVREQKLK